MPQRNFLLKCVLNDLTYDEKYAETETEADAKAMAHKLRTQNPDCHVTWEKIGTFRRAGLFIAEKVFGRRF